MTLTRIEIWLNRLIQRSEKGRGFLWMCLLLAGVGTFTAGYPITMLVASATLLAPHRWRSITLMTALGSAVGATLLMMAFSDLGWAYFYEQFPQLPHQAAWQNTIRWVSDYGIPALFLIAATPFPQTPALMFFGMTHHDPAAVFLAMLGGKLLKYGLLAWLVAVYPEQAGRGPIRMLIRSIRRLWQKG